MKIGISVVCASLFTVCVSLDAAETNLSRDFPMTNASSIATEVLPPALTANTAGRLVPTESFAPAPIPEPSDKAVRFYHSGIVWWLVSEGWSWFVPAIILLTGLAGWLGRHAKRIGRWEAPATFVFVLFYFLVAFVLSFPIDYFRDYVRPHDYGLSNQTFARWMDHSLKQMLVNVVVFGATFMVLRLLIRKNPRRWWIYCSVFVGAVVFFMAFIFPIWIDPLFNRFGPLEDKKLEADIVALARRAGIEDAGVYQVDMSADTKVFNAYVSGLGGTKRIVLWDTMIGKVGSDEIRFVLAHEMGHYVLRHVLFTCLLLTLTYAGALWLVDRLGKRIISKLSHRLGFASLSDLGAIPLLFLFMAVFMFLTAPLLNAASRYHEHEADRYALELTHNNRAAALYFVNSQENNLMVPRPAWLEHTWRGTHPSRAERIDFANSYHPWTTGQPGKYEHLFKSN